MAMKRNTSEDIQSLLDHVASGQLSRRGFYVGIAGGGADRRLP